MSGQPKETARLAARAAKKAARLNTIAHLLSVIPHKKLKDKKVTLPKRSSKGAYDDRASIARRRFVPERY